MRTTKLKKRLGYFLVRLRDGFPVANMQKDDFDTADILEDYELVKWVGNPRHQYPGLKRISMEEAELY